VSVADPETILFISDLHLTPEQPARAQRLRGFLERRARAATRLYVLGDLFEVWIGDDDPAHDDTLQALRALTAAGVDCRVMRGNRDFLLGRGFARTTGCVLIDDPHLVHLGGEAVLLTHGDLLCTADRAYQRFRRWVRNPLVKQWFLWHSRDWRQRFADDYRRRGRAAMASKPAAIMDVDPAAVRALMLKHGARRLVHGHTHRPGDYTVTLDTATGQRHVLAEWNATTGEALVYAGGCWRREPIGWEHA